MTMLRIPRDVLVGSPALSDQDLQLVVSDSMYRNEWATRVWPAYDVEENYPEAAGMIEVQVRDMEKVETVDRVRKKWWRSEPEQRR